MRFRPEHAAHARGWSSGVQTADASSRRATSAVAALWQHWPEFTIEAAGLGSFMVSACVFGTLFFHPGSAVARVLQAYGAQRIAMGAAMGSTAIALIYSPWGRRSGAHINPAVTFAFWRLRKVRGWDAIFYILAQFVGAACGVVVSAFALREWVMHPAVNYVVTVPGPSLGLAFLIEALMACGLMSIVLISTNSPRLARFTGIFAGVLVATYIALLEPFSGMSINPARSFGSALRAGVWTGFWIYLLAPPIGMLVAAEIFTRVRRAREVVCAKLVHDHSSRCIFRCRFPMQ